MENLNVSGRKELQIYKNKSNEKEVNGTRCFIKQNRASSTFA